MTLPTLYALTDFASDLIRDLGLVGLVALMFAENVFPPIPSEVMLPLAGYFVSTGDLNFIGVLVAATVGSVLGSVALYELARAGGRPFILRYGSLLRLTEKDLDRADEWFTKRGPVIVLLGRCVPGVRSLVSLPAGTLKMSRPLYLLLTTIGTCIWNAALIGAGWAFGAEWEQVSGSVGVLSKPLLGLLLVVLGVASVVWWAKRRREDGGTG